MKTDNSNIVSEKIESWNAGAQWQKEQLQPLIDELRNALIRINSISDVPNGSTWSIEFATINTISAEAIEKANKLIQ